jgi:hypothetical protein
MTKIRHDFIWFYLKDQISIKKIKPKWSYFVSLVYMIFLHITIYTVDQWYVRLLTTFLSWLKNALRCDDQSLVIKPQGFYTGKSWTRLAQKKTYEVTVWPKIVQIVLTLRIYNRKHKVLTQLAIQVDWIGIHHSKKNKLQKHRIELICYGRNLNN